MDFHLSQRYFSLIGLYVQRIWLQSRFMDMDTMHQKIQQGRCIRIWSEPIQQKATTVIKSPSKVAEINESVTNWDQPALGAVAKILPVQWLVAPPLPLTGFKIQFNLNFWKGGSRVCGVCGSIVKEH